MDALLHLVLTAILLVATVTDLRWRRIPNWLTFPAMLLAIATHGMLQGLDGLQFSLFGFGLGLGLLIVPFLMGVMGAGDVKLMAAVGAFLGPIGVFQAFVFTSLLGGVYALAILISRPGLLKRIFISIKDTIGLFMGTRRLAYVSQTSGEKLPKLAYGVAIAAGTAVTMLQTSGIANFMPTWLT